MAGKGNGMPELNFGALTPKQLSSRTLLVEEMERMADKAVQRWEGTL